MPKPHELAGLRFERLTAIEKSGRQSTHTLWTCRCDCGNLKTVTANNLVRGLVKSCGCLRLEMAAAKFTTHGMCGTGTYKSWQSMMDRCSNPNSRNYARYGAAGVTVCQRWTESFADFLCDMGPRPTGTTLDRVENHRGYDLSNCRWATRREQRMNQSRGTISEAQAAEVRRLRAEHGWGQNTIAKELGISPGAAAGVIWLGNLKAP